MRPYQVVVFGASGFTGRLVCEHIAKNYQGKLRWAMAGRKPAKLEEIRTSLANVNPAVRQVDIRQADSFDSSSLLELAKSTDVIISTVGPYGRYGKPLVQACVEAGTHYTDLTGELYFVRDCVDSFHEQAAEKNVRIVHCCGFDCVPSDMLSLMAVDHMKERHGEEVGQATMYYVDAMGSFSGGTTESFIGVLQRDPAERERNSHPYFLVPEKAGVPVSQLNIPESPFAPQYSALSKGWTAPSVMAQVDEPVVRRSASLLGYGEKFNFTERTQLNGNFLTASLTTAGIAALGAAVYTAANVPALRGLLPSPGEGPDRQSMDNGFWKLKLLAQSSSPSSSRVVEARLQDLNGDPGYMSTSRMLLECALALAMEQEALAADPYASRHSGGVLTAACLGLVLLRRLQAVGLDASTRDVYASS